ncbi:unnamed protein product [Sphagnum jensenii]
MKKPQRNPVAVAMSQRYPRSKSFIDKRQERGGDKNEQGEYLEEACHGVIPGTFILCGEGGNYCSDSCYSKAGGHLRGSNARFWHPEAGCCGGTDRHLDTCKEPYTAPPDWSERGNKMQTSFLTQDQIDQFETEYDLLREKLLLRDEKDSDELYHRKLEIANTMESAWRVFLHFAETDGVDFNRDGEKICWRCGYGFSEEELKAE